MSVCSLRASYILSPDRVRAQLLPLFAVNAVMNLTSVGRVKKNPVSPHLRLRKDLPTVSGIKNE